MYYIDTETCGFHGPCVLIQFAMDDEPVTVWDVFLNSIDSTLSVIHKIANHPGGVCGFNLVYDWFHINKIENMLAALRRKIGGDKRPIDHIKELAAVESEARDGDCVKPVTALDLMLFARKGPYQSTMDRKEIRIRRVAKPLAHVLCQELERKIPLNPIYFSRSKSKTQWRIGLIKDARTGEYDREFVDVYLKFSPSSALKAIVIDAGLRDADRLLFSDVRPSVQPIEYAYAPVATVITDDHEHWFIDDGKKKGFAWPKVIEDHVFHWKHSAKGREYAADDVDDLRLLRQYFGSPEAGDDDSILACAVGSIRWRGVAIDLEAVKKLRDAELLAIKQAPKAPHKVYAWLTEVMKEEELIAFKDRNGKTTTKKTILEKIATLKSTCSCVTFETRKEVVENDDVSEFGFGGTTYRTIQVPRARPDCPDCVGSGSVKHAASVRATACLNARKGATKAAMFNKLIRAGRLHPAASVIGSLSGRMSGRTEVGDGKRSGNINALGIQHDKAIRASFPMAFPGYALCGGDFVSYEVSIAEATYDDPILREQLCTCDNCGYVCSLDDYQTDICPSCGGFDTRRKFHGLFAMELNPGLSYTDIIATKGSKVKDLYDQGKRGVFSQLYGGDENTLVERLGIELEAAREASNRLKTKYKGIGRAYKKAFDDHCSMRQPGGIGKKVEWHEPKEYVESLTGFRRWFTLENRITKALFVLGETPPASWLELKGQVKRRDRLQSIAGSVRSALFGAAFQIQATCMRAALNHKIQSTGAILTKALQVRIWKYQPTGVQPWHVQPINIHDEIMCPAKPELQPQIQDTVREFVKESRELIPLIRIDWKSNMKNWSEK